MNTPDIIRAWKDAEYRESLTDAERSLLPENPVGLIEIPTAALTGIAGGKPINRPVTQVHCPSHRPGGCNPTHRPGCGGTIKLLL